MVEDNVGDTFDIVVPGHGDHGHGKVETPGSVDGDEAVDGAFHENVRVFIDEIGAVPMAGDEVEVTLLQEVIFDAAHDGSGIAVADFGNNYADGKAALRAQGAGKEVGTIFEFAGSGEDAIFGVLGDGVGDGRTVDDKRDSGGGKGEVFRQVFQTHGFAGGAPGDIAARFWLSCAHGPKSRTRKWREQAEILREVGRGY